MLLKIGSVFSEQDPFTTSLRSPSLVGLSCSKPGPGRAPSPVWESRRHMRVAVPWPSLPSSSFQPVGGGLPLPLLPFVVETGITRSGGNQEMAWPESQQWPAWAQALKLSGESLWEATCSWGVRQHQELSSRAAASSHLCTISRKASGPAAKTGHSLFLYASLCETMALLKVVPSRLSHGHFSYWFP